jgi:hypothetical protein
MSLKLFSYFNHSEIKILAHTQKNFADFFFLNLFRHFCSGGKNVTNKKGLFYAKIF